MCFACLSYYLLDRIHEDGGDKHDVDIQELAVLRSGMTERDEWHDCKNQRVMCGGTIGDGDVHKAPHN